MKFAGIGLIGKIAVRIASFFIPPHKAGGSIAYMHKKGYVSPSAVIYHPELWLGEHVYIAEQVTIFNKNNGGSIKIGDRVCIYKHTIIETGYGATLHIGADASVHPRCQINAFIAPISIGKGVMIAPNCAIYSYDHGIAPDKPIREQQLQTKGPVVIDDEAWLGVGAIVLSGVRIGRGAVIGAGAVVMNDIPDGAIAVGNPARVVKRRQELRETRTESITTE